MNALGLSCDVELVPRQEVWSDLTQLLRYEERICSLGTKDNPTIIDGVQLHPDSLACEFAPVKPASSVGEFFMLYQHAREVAQAYMGMHLQGCDWVDTSMLPLFSEAICPTVYKTSNECGCSPDNIILRSGKVKYRDVVPSWVLDRPVRECSFHLHINWRTDTEEWIKQGVEDYYARTRMLHQWTHPTAMPWYRKPMVFRPKSYGFEYRSLGASLAENQSALEMAVVQAFRMMEGLH